MAKAIKPDPSAIAAAMTAPLLMPNGSTLSLGCPLALFSSGLLWMLMPMPSGAEDNRSRDVSPNLRLSPRRTGRVPMRTRVPVPMRVCAGGVHSCMRQPATCACACWHAMPLPRLAPSIATLMLGASDRLQNACARPVRAAMSASVRMARIVAGKRRPLGILRAFFVSAPWLQQPPCHKSSFGSEKESTLCSRHSHLEDGGGARRGPGASAFRAA